MPLPKTREGLEAVTTKGGGYLVVLMKDHPRANSNGHVKAHVLIAERAFGKPLHSKHPVHHFDNDRENNRNNNLVICENASYHMLLHSRTRIVLGGGNPDSESICFICRKVKPFNEFHKNSSRWNGVSSACKNCNNADNRIKRKLRYIRPLMGVGKYSRESFKGKDQSR